MGWGTELVVAIALMKLVALQAQETPPSPGMGTPEGAHARPGCKSDCGGVPIPYPFGIGPNCYHPSSGYFQVNCTNNRPMLADFYGEFKYEVRNISLWNSTVRVSTTTLPICNERWSFKFLWNGYNMRLAPSANVFAVIGCNVLAFFSGYAYTNEDYVDASSRGVDIYVNRTVGCMSTCFPSKRGLRTKQVVTEVCSEGCCQTSIDIAASYYKTIARDIDDGNLTTISNVTKCYYAFVVEKGNFKFSVEKHTILPKDSITYTFLGEWSIGNYKTCGDALKNMSIYACVSSNSECVNSISWGYTCRCKAGYAGNPYLSEGCRDVNGCGRNYNGCPKDWICSNQLGIYTCLPLKSNTDHLHIWNRDTPLSWEDRLRIAIEISGALSYLHSSASISIFHRDIKSSNILLDEKLTAKISDFGASKFIDMDQTHVSTNIQGTFGYLDPEYMHTGQLTEKSDVYSLGVILVELVTGEKPTSKMKSQEERNLISHFIWAFKENKLFQVVEASIVEDSTREEIAAVARLAMDCLGFRGTERPTMKEVEVALQGLRKFEVQRKLKAVTPTYEQEEVESISYHSSSYPRSETTK